MRNKRGWIKIVEAFISILLVTGVLLVIINRGYIGKSEISSRVYDAEVSILREIELNDDLRREILEIDEKEISFPLSSTDKNFPLSVTNKINERVPNYLTCEAQICELDKVCVLDKYIDRDVYVQSVAIAANLENYKPRQLKLFCYIG